MVMISSPPTNADQSVDGMTDAKHCLEQYAQAWCVAKLLCNQGDCDDVLLDERHRLTGCRLAGAGLWFRCSSAGNLHKVRKASDLLWRGVGATSIARSEVSSAKNPTNHVFLTFSHRTTASNFEVLKPSLLKYHLLRDTLCS